MGTQFQYANLSRMDVLPKCAIICRTAEEAEEFFYNVNKQFPDRICWSLEDLMDLWRNYESETGFTFFCTLDTEPGSISYCDTSWFKRNGYVLIEYSELVDSPELEDSGLPIDFLIGGVPCK